MEEISIHYSFEELPPSFAKTFAETHRVSGIFSSLPWFRNLGATGLGQETRLRIYAMDSGGGQPCLILPMCHRQANAGLFSTRRLEAASTFYTSLFGPVIAQSDRSGPNEQENLNRLAKVIARESPRWDVVDLHPMDIAAQSFAGMKHAFRSAGMAVQSYFCFGNWYLLVKNRSFDAYFSTLPTKLQNTVTRKSRQFNQLVGAGRARLEIISDQKDAVEAAAAFVQVYNASWKNPEPFPDFIPGLIQTCAQEGWLRLGIAYIDDQPAAAQIWIVSQQVASIYKLAYDEQFSRYSLGSILTARLMQHVLDVDQVQEVDYLTGDEAYKQDWMSHRRERRGIVAFNLRTLKGMLLAVRHLGGQSIKNIFSARRRKP